MGKAHFYQLSYSLANNVKQPHIILATYIIYIILAVLDANLPPTALFCKPVNYHILKKTLYISHSFLSSFTTIIIYV